VQREIGGFRDRRKHERAELSQSIEVVGKGAFGADEEEVDETRSAHEPIFVTAGDASWLQRKRRRGPVFIARNKPEEAENRQVALCVGNVHDIGVVEVTASSASGTDYPQNAVDLEDNELVLFSEDEPGQWICLDFKTVRIEPMP
jgi:hypothetical protein